MIRAGIRRLFRLALHREADAKRDVADEVRLHLDLRADQLIAEGYAPEDARAEAERRFAASSAERTALAARASHREATFRWHEWLESFANDLRYVLRGLRRSRGFTATVVLTLALGLGANAAVFAVLDRMFLQAPVGVRQPENVKRLYRRYTDSRTSLPAYLTVFSYPMVRGFADASPPGVQMAGYRTATQVPLGRDESASPGVLTYVVGDYFGTLGVAMESGRPFTPDEYRAEGLAQVIVLSHDLAVNRFGSAAAAVGRQIDVLGHRYTIVGVASPGFRGTDLDASDVWAPLNSRGSWLHPDARWLNANGTLFIAVLVRAPDAAGLANAQADAGAAMRRFPMFKDTTATVVFNSIREAISPAFQADAQRITTRLAGVALAILLIACANVANILLARALARRREVAVRLALGVSRARLVRQMVTESVVLALIAGTGSVIVAAWSASVLRTQLVPSTHWGGVAVGWRAIAFAAGAALVAGIAAGLVPAFNASRPQLTGALRGGAREGSGHRSRLRSALLVAQVALSLALLVGAGLFIRSLRQVQAIDIGYDEDQVVFAGISRPRLVDAPQSVTAATVSQTLMDATDRIARMPAVEAVAFSENVPLLAFSFIDHFLPDRDSLPTPAGVMTTVSFVSPGFFTTMGVRLLDGRDFTPADRLGAEPVLVVNETMAATFWPGEHAVGKCLILHTRAEPCRRVVGVVSNAHFSGMIEGQSMQFYVPLLQEGDDGKTGYAGTLEIRAAPGRTAAVSEAVRKDLERAAPPGGRVRVTTMRDQLTPQLRTWRLGAQLFSLAGLLALLVAAVGIYGNVSYSLSQRTHEMGVRIALGARAADIVRLIVGEGLRVIVLGVAAGIALALGAGRLIQSMLYGTTAHDPWVLGAVSLVLVVAAVAASLGPALRATRVDPIDSLRSD